MRLPLLLPLAALAAVLVAAPSSAAPTSTATAAVAAPGGATGTDITVTLASGRSYILFRPTKPNAKPGLVVALHHFGGNASAFESHTGLDLGAGTTGNFVAYPESGRMSWNAGLCCAPATTSGADDVAFLDQIIDDVKARTGVVEGRVAMVGFSNGGMMAYRYSCERPTRAPLIVPDAATNLAVCSRTSPVSVVAVHGALDLGVPWGGGVSSLSVLAGLRLPAVTSVVAGSAAQNRCTGGFVQDKTPKGQDRWTAKECPAGVQVAIIRSATLGHYWPAGAADLTTYGVDTTGLVWAMATGRWATS